MMQKVKLEFSNLFRRKLLVKTVAHVRQITVFVNDSFRVYYINVIKVIVWIDNIVYISFKIHHVTTIDNYQDYITALFNSLY